MYKVKIADSEGEDFETEMPQIPKIKESIGYWFYDEWIVMTVKKVTFDFKEDNSYLLAEIYCIPE